MGIVAKQASEFKRELIPADTYQAVCYGVVDIGTQEGSYMGTPTQKRQVIIFWEIPDIVMEIEKDGKKMKMPRVISKFYTLSLSEKANLYHDLVSWRGRPFTKEELDGFDVTKIIGANCFLGIVHNTKSDGSVRESVHTVGKLMKGIEPKTPKTPIWKYSMMDDGMNIPNTLPQWIVDIIKKSKEYQAFSHAQTVLSKETPDENWKSEEDSSNLVDEIPF